ncbi:MAG TPA: hypothetical protein VGH94_02200 [Acidimicrobiales bacterium]|jgi:hypothetical protein
MGALVEHLHFKDPIDPELFRTAERDLVPLLRGIDGFRDFHVMHTSDHDVVLFVQGDNLEALAQIADELGSAWMHDTVMPLLSKPPERHIGPVIASSG